MSANAQLVEQTILEWLECSHGQHRRTHATDTSYLLPCTLAAFFRVVVLRVFLSDDNELTAFEKEMCSLWSRIGHGLSQHRLVKVLKRAFEASMRCERVLGRGKINHGLTDAKRCRWCLKVLEFRKYNLGINAGLNLPPFFFKNFGCS